MTRNYLLMVSRFYEVLVYDEERRGWSRELLFDCWRYADALEQAASIGKRARVDKILCQGTYELTRRTLFDSAQPAGAELPSA